MEICLDEIVTAINILRVEKALKAILSNCVFETTFIQDSRFFIVNQGVQSLFDCLN